MPIIVHSPHSGLPVKVREQDVGRAVRDAAGKIFYVLPRPDGKGYFGSTIRGGGEAELKRYEEVVAKAGAGGGLTEDAQLGSCGSGPHNERAEIFDARGKGRAGTGSRRWVLIVLILALLGAVAWAVFHYSQGKAMGAPGAQTQPAKAGRADSGTGGRTLRLIAFDELKWLDPQRITWLSDIRIAECLFEPLLRIDPATLKPVPAAAESYEVSSDGLTYTFHLRPEARWSNGDPVQSTDFQFAWHRALLPDLASDYSNLFFCIAGAEQFFNWRSEQLKQLAKAATQPSDFPVGGAGAPWTEAELHLYGNVGISAPDAHTLVVKLDHYTPYFPYLCAFITFAPVHEKSVRAALSINPDTGMLVQDPLWTKPGRLISNGPYVLESRRINIDLHLTANPHYWNRAQMANDGIIQKRYMLPPAALMAYKSGEVDWIPDIPTADPIAAALVEQHRPEIHAFTVAGTYFYNYNCRPKLENGSANKLADPRVRRALSLAIDRQTIVDKVTRLKQPVAKTFIPPGSIVGYAPPVAAGVGYDPEAARKLLAEAGYPGGKGLTGLTILYNTDGAHQTLAQQVKNLWEQELGVVVSLEGVERGVFGERLRKGQFTISRAGWEGDYPDPTTFLDKLESGNGNNDGGWSNKTYDDLLKESSSQRDPATRLPTLEKAEALMLAEQPMALLFHYVHVEVFDPAKVTGLEPNAWNRHRLEMVAVRR